MISWEQSINIKTPQEIEIMREAGRINAEALQAAVSLIEPGVTTAELNAAFEAVHRQYGVYSPFKNYPGPYPILPAFAPVNEELRMAFRAIGSLKKAILSASIAARFTRDLSATWPLPLEWVKSARTHRG